MALDLSKPRDEPKLRQGDGSPASLKAPDVYVLLPPGDPNAWVLIGRTAAAIRLAHGAELQNRFTEDAMRAESYSALWSTIYSWVNVEVEVRPP